ncbi:hypothetical protein KQX54_010231 [Cotesia glomerata]|uniref:Uncharacterized protein n=1 Tax=Cotesia glomerata TaxID=32391 RepID=A0AAV7IU81_COTGL|nr:hypothetical protein KQX54_010231 [Cotesia glomerata]
MCSRVSIHIQQRLALPWKPTGHSHSHSQNHGINVSISPAPTLGIIPEHRSSFKHTYDIEIQREVITPGNINSHRKCHRGAAIEMEGRDEIECGWDSGSGERVAFLVSLNPKLSKQPFRFFERGEDRSGSLSPIPAEGSRHENESE